MPNLVKATVESDEAFLVDISNLSNNFAGNLTVTKAQGNATITNDDTAELTINDVIITETNSGTVNAVFNVVPNAQVNAGFTLDYATTDNTATLTDSDYVASSGTLTFTGGLNETQTITVAVNGDTIVEGNEAFLVDISNLSNNFAGNLSITNAQGNAAIINDDAANLTINDISLIASYVVSSSDYHKDGRRNPEAITARTKVSDCDWPSKNLKLGPQLSNAPTHSKL